MPSGENKHTESGGGAVREKPEEKAWKKYYTTVSGGGGGGDGGRTKDQGPSRLLVKVCALRPASCDKVQILLIIRAFVRFALCFQMFFQSAVGKTFCFPHVIATISARSPRHFFLFCVPFPPLLMIKNRASSVIRRNVHLPPRFVLFGQDSHMLTPATLADQGKRGIFAEDLRDFQGWALMCGLHEESGARTPGQQLHTAAENYAAKCRKY